MYFKTYKKEGNLFWVFFLGIDGIQAGLKLEKAVL
jgi:hypothetical protein